MIFNYLQDPQDLKEIINGFKKARQLIAQPAFDEFRGVELKPGPDVNQMMKLKNGSEMLRKQIITQAALAQWDKVKWQL